MLLHKKKIQTQSLKTVSSGSGLVRIKLYSSAFIAQEPSNVMIKVQE